MRGEAVRPVGSLADGASRPLSEDQQASLSVVVVVVVVVAWTPSVGIGRPILLAAPRSVGSIERRTGIAIGTTRWAVSPSAFSHHAIMPYRSLTNWKAGIGSWGN
jgi:hypothetical protein